MSGAEDEALSPKHKLKFLCSYGGKILPRPSDGQLKYVGGETRVVCVPRSITFSELKEKISGMFNKTAIVIKYQLMSEDLDALVSVRSDEDLRHMLDEYDRYDPRSPSGSPRFRIFLFSTTTTDSATPSSYIDAVNAATIPLTPKRPSPLFTVSSSTCTSPTSTTIDSSAPAINGFGFGRPNGLGGGSLHRVHSSPGSLSQLANAGPGSPRGYQQKPTWPTRMGASQRHEVCGCVVSGQQSQRRYYYLPPGGSACMYRGPVEEGPPAPPLRGSGGAFHYGTPPMAPRRGIWE